MSGLPELPPEILELIAGNLKGKAKEDFIAAAKPLHAAFIQQHSHKMGWASPQEFLGVMRSSKIPLQLKQIIYKSHFPAGWSVKEYKAFLENPDILDWQKRLVAGGMSREKLEERKQKIQPEALEELASKLSERMYSNAPSDPSEREQHRQAVFDEFLLEEGIELQGGSTLDRWHYSAAIEPQFLKLLLTGIVRTHDEMNQYTLWAGSYFQQPHFLTSVTATDRQIIKEGLVDALEHRYLTLEDFGRLYHDTKCGEGTNAKEFWLRIFSKETLAAVKEGIITYPQIIDIAVSMSKLSDPNFKPLNTLLTAEGFRALKEGVFTLEWAKQCCTLHEVMTSPGHKGFKIHQVTAGDFLMQRAIQTGEVMPFKQAMPFASPQYKQPDQMHDRIDALELRALQFMSSPAAQKLQDEGWVGDIAAAKSDFKAACRPSRQSAPPLTETDVKKYLLKQVLRGAAKAQYDWITAGRQGGGLFTKVLHNVQEATRLNEFINKLNSPTLSLDDTKRELKSFCQQEKAHRHSFIGRLMDAIKERPGIQDYLDLHPNKAVTYTTDRADKAVDTARVEALQTLRGPRS